MMVVVVGSCGRSSAESGLPSVVGESEHLCLVGLLVAAAIVDVVVVVGGVMVVVGG